MYLTFGNNNMIMYYDW